MAIGAACRNGMTSGGLRCCLRVSARRQKSEIALTSAYSGRPCGAAGKNIDGAIIVLSTDKVGR
ncbi:MAG: hypothetical protein AB7P23_00430 [Amphiplicatus sp.]